MEIKYMDKKDMPIYQSIVNGRTRAGARGRYRTIIEDFMNGGKDAMQIDFDEIKKAKSFMAVCSRTYGKEYGIKSARENLTVYVWRSKE